MKNGINRQVECGGVACDRILFSIKEMKEYPTICNSVDSPKGYYTK